MACESIALWRASIVTVGCCGDAIVERETFTMGSVAGFVEWSTARAVCFDDADVSLNILPPENGTFSILFYCVADCCGALLFG